MFRIKVRLKRIEMTCIYSRGINKNNMQILILFLSEISFEKEVRYFVSQIQIENISRRKINENKEFNAGERSINMIKGQS